MNEFYSIGEETSEPKDSFQLKNLGTKKPFITIGGRRSWDGSINDSETFYTNISTEDYDRLFVDKLTKIKPPYEINKLLDYHLKYYLSKNIGLKDKFLKHVKYVVIPEVKKKKDKEVYTDLINEWLKENTEPMKDNVNKLNIGDINAPTQIVIDSNGAVQNQTVNYSSESILELFELIKADLKNMESDLKDELLIEVENATRHLQNNKDITSRLKTIGVLIKDIGINVFANLAAAPLYDHIKPLLGM